jgi:hypothetical protein
MRSPLGSAFGWITLGTFMMAPVVAAQPSAEELPPQVLPAERPLQAVLDVAMGRVVVNRARSVRVERVSAGPPLRFALVNTSGRRQSIRIGILHLPDGDYNVHTLGVTGASRHTSLSSSHLAAGWRFVLGPPQTGTRYGQAVRRLTQSVEKTGRLLSGREEPELTKALAPLAAALRRARLDLAATRRLEVAIVPVRTATVPLPTCSPALSEPQMADRLEELDRLRRGVIAAADRSGDAALANRIQRWFHLRLD